MKKSVRLFLLAVLAAAILTFTNLSAPSYGETGASLFEGHEAYLLDFNSGTLSNAVYNDGSVNSWKFSGDTANVTLENGQLKFGPAAASTIGVFDYGFATNPDTQFKNFEVSFDVTLAGFTTGGNFGFQFQKTGWSNGWGVHNKVYVDTGAAMAFLNGTTRLTDRLAISSNGGPAITASQVPWESFRVKIRVEGSRVEAYINNASEPIVSYEGLDTLGGYTDTGFVGLFSFANITTLYDNFLFNTLAEESGRKSFEVTAQGGNLLVDVPETPERLSGYHIYYTNVTDTTSPVLYSYEGAGDETVTLPADMDKVYRVELRPVYTSERTAVETELTVYKEAYALTGTPPAVLSATEDLSFQGETAEVELSVVGAEVLYYTLDGTVPGPSNGEALLGNGAFGTTLTLGNTTLLKAAAYTGGVETASLQRTYTALPNTPVIEDPLSYHQAYFHGEKSIDISALYADALLYTTDGSQPIYNAASGTAENGTLISTGKATVTLPLADTVLKVMAVRSGNTGNIATESFFYLTSGTQTAFYVDPVNGSDGGTGSEADPFKSIAAARDAVRAINGSMTGDIYVYLRGGTHKLTQTLELDERDSGTRSFQVVYRAYPNEVPVLSGGEQINGWTLYDGQTNIYRAPANGLDTRQLYVDGRRAVRARSEEGLPNATFNETGHTTSMTEMAQWQNIDDIELVYKERWTSPRYSVDTISVSGNTATLVMDQPGWSYGRDKGSTAPTVPWYIENALELLDEPGEWYLDKTGDYFYYMPLAEEDMSQVQVTVPVLTELLTVKGENEDSPVHDLGFEGITFSYAGWLRPSTDVGHSDVQANYVREPALPGNTYKQEFIIDAAVVLSSGKSVRFERNRFTGLGATGLNILKGSQNIDIVGNEFFDISGSGVQIGEVDMNDINNRYPSDPKYLLKNITVSNNYIHRVAVEYMAGAGVSAAYPDTLKIVHNEFENLPYSAIHIGWGWSVVPANATKNNLIAYNIINNCMTTLHDGGAFYVVGSSSGSGGVSYVVNNYIKNISNYHGALYFDQGSSDWRANGNVIENVQKFFMANGAKGNVLADGNFTDSLGAAAQAGMLENTVYVTDGSWPTEAQSIKSSAGIEPAYADILPPVRPEDPEEGEYLLYDDFEEYVTGGNMTEWNKVQTGGLVRVAEETGNRYMALDSTGIGGGTAVVSYRFFKGSYGEITLEYKIRSTSSQGFRLAPYLAGASSDFAITLGMMDGNFVNNKGGGNVAVLCPFNANQWYNVKMVVNTFTQKFDLFIDNALILNQENFRAASPEIDQIRFGNEVTVAGELAVDDIRIYKSGSAGSE